MDLRNNPRREKSPLQDQTANRREFIAASATGITAATTGCLISSGRSPEPDNPNDSAESPDSQASSGPEQIEISVSLFIDDVFAEYTIDVNLSHTLDQWLDVLRCAIDPIDSHDRLTIDKQTVEDPINISKHVEGHPLNATMDWEQMYDYIVQAAESHSTEAYSNVLLTGMNLRDVRGFGLHEGEYAIVEAPTPFTGFDSDELCVERTLASDGQFLTYLLHEVGHNFGLTHNMGTVLEMDTENAYVTPMLFGYARSDDYVGTENRFGDMIPDIGDRHVIQVPHYNPDISIEDMKFI